MVDVVIARSTFQIVEGQAILRHELPLVDNIDKMYGYEVREITDQGGLRPNTTDNDTVHTFQLTVVYQPGGFSGSIFVLNGHRFNITKAGGNTQFHGTAGTTPERQNLAGLQAIKLWDDGTFNRSRMVAWIGSWGGVGSHNFYRFISKYFENRTNETFESIDNELNIISDADPVDDPGGASTFLQTVAENVNAYYTVIASVKE